MSRKLICTHDQLLTLAKKHSVSKYETEIPAAVLLKFRGVHRSMLESDVNEKYYRFCELSYELLSADEAFRLRLWNWPDRILHSTLVIYQDNTYDIEDHTELGRLHSRTVWKHFFYCAKKDTFFKMPREVRL